MSNEIYKFYSRGDSSTTPTMTRGAFFRKISKHAIPIIQNSGLMPESGDRSTLQPIKLINKQAKTARKRKAHHKKHDIFHKRRRGK